MQRCERLRDAAQAVQPAQQPYNRGSPPLGVGMSGSGSLVCVGIGMTLGSHLTPLAKSYIAKSDVVFAATSDGIIEMWLSTLHPDVRSLQPLYREGKVRMETYREMVEAMLKEVRAGKRVCGAFYGHPGVFA